jgi:hypothetical protein
LRLGKRSCDGGVLCDAGGGGVAAATPKAAADAGVDTVNVGGGDPADDTAELGIGTRIGEVMAKRLSFTRTPPPPLAMYADSGDVGKDMA